ncbi:MAG: DNA replication and repair protein RecF [Tenericutes bacterium ADurb.BinA124]|nr:MAG: DNA replication and repair protein RecF [Tenericutes bacterium ADurb.BinA124]
MFHLKRLNIQNFRCYAQFNEQFSPTINILVGNNAVGKTSLVEAVYCAGLGKSYKALNDQELIKNNENYAFVKAEFTEEGKNDEIVFSVVNGKKKIQQNGQIIDRLSDYFGYINVVLFSADDLNLIKGTPAHRREFLDSSISQNNKPYLKALLNYRKYLKQRNEFLKQTDQSTNYDALLLETITEKLIKEAKTIIFERQEFVKALNEKLKTINYEISDEKDCGAIVYVPNRTIDELEKSFKERIQVDLALKTTTIGPHRDDFIPLINQKHAYSFASSGQQRTLALALKLSLAALCQSQNSRLIIVLDDVFSELDANRQNKIMKYLDKGQQIIITTTSIEALSPAVIKKSKIMEIIKEERDEQR